MYSIKKILLLILSLLFAQLSFGKEEIKIGISTFLSGGAASSFGIPLKQGLEFMFNAINEGKVIEGMDPRQQYTRVTVDNGTTGSQFIVVGSPGIVESKLKSGRQLLNG